MNAERLLTLANFLREKVPEEHFDLGVFVNRIECEDVLDRLPKIAAGQQRGCGAAACAIGWCPGAFPDHWEWNADALDGVSLKGWSDGNGFVLAMRFFEINSINCYYLFDPGSYPNQDDASREEVASRIESFAEGSRA
jgi:hypothetical protein